jgi:hypothetical protein
MVSRSMFIRPWSAPSRRPRGPGAGPRPAPCRRRIRPRVAGRPARSRGPGLAPARSGARPRRGRRPPSRTRCSRTAPSAASGCSQKGATLKAKTLSKRRSPRSTSSSAMASSTALPASTCSRFLRVAISIILDERSIAVIVPVVSLSQTRETATPWPQPTSSRRSAGRTSRVSTAQTNRSDALPATAPEIASHAREAHAAASGARRSQRAEPRGCRRGGSRRAVAADSGSSGSWGGRAPSRGGRPKHLRVIEPHDSVRDLRQAVLDREVSGVQADEFGIGQVA